VPHVVEGFGTPDARPLHHVLQRDLRALAARGEFASGSMGPKVEAVLRFISRAGSQAAICALSDIVRAVDGGAGTIVAAESVNVQT
jgi:carbamate kinase